MTAKRYRVLVAVVDESDVRACAAFDQAQQSLEGVSLVSYPKRDASGLRAVAWLVECSRAWGDALVRVEAGVRQ